QRSCRARFAGKNRGIALIYRLLLRHKCRVLRKNRLYFTSMACDATHCHLSLRRTQTSVQRKLRLNACPSLALPPSVEIPVATANCPPNTRTSTLPFFVEL